jgi:hypothetical protein
MDRAAMLQAQAGAGKVSAGGSAVKYHFQPWLTLSAPGGTDDVIQPCRHWLDGINESTLHMKIEMTYVTNATLVIEAALSREGPWMQCAMLTAATYNMLVMSSEGGAMTFGRYVRWRVDGHAANPWEVCFQLMVTSGAMSDAKLAPRKA